MRVALVNEHASAARGGAETSLLETARALSDLGVEVSLVAAGPADAPPRCRTLACGAPGATRAARTRAFVRRAADLCAQEGFDVVHALLPLPTADVYQPRGGTFPATIEGSLARSRVRLLRAARRFGRSLNRRQRCLLRLERALLTRPDPPFVAAVSECVRRQVVADYPAAAARTRVVFNGVGLTPLAEADAARLRRELRTRFASDAVLPTVLFVAHNFALKGLAELLRAGATPEGRRAGWALWVAGRGRARPYERLAARLGLAQRVRFLGPVEDVRGLYAAADLLAHPTWYDPCSRVVLEALCCGLPVVTTRLNGAAEAMRPGVHGQVVDSPADVDALAAALTRGLSAEVRDACRRDAESMRERLSMARHARELLALYERAVGERRACGRF